MIGWNRCLTAVLVGFASLVAISHGFIALMNPYGHLPWRPFGAHAIMDINQRFQYPSIVRSRAFDSIVIGTSTARLLDPDRLDTRLGGRFANLAMNDARAWEQYRLAQLFLVHEPQPKTLLIALDLVWCDPRADVDRITARGFPEWLYDETSWNDRLYLLNPSTLEFAGRLVMHRLGLRPARIPANGFAVFVPPESAYDAAKAEAHIWRGRSRDRNPMLPSYVPTVEDRREWKLPAMAWLDELLASAPTSTHSIVAFMPTHIGNQPVPGSREAAREEACKAGVWEVGKRRNATLIDFRIASDITVHDKNFWDPLHYRLPIGDRIIDGIATAVATRLDDPGGDWRFISSRAGASQ